MSEFHQTVGGRKFYEGTMPSIASSLSRISNQLVELNENLLKVLKALEQKASEPSNKGLLLEER